jgi:hypothetical protein
VFANQVHDAPAAVPMLDVPELKGRDFGAPQTAAEQDGGGVMVVIDRSSATALSRSPPQLVVVP